MTATMNRSGIALLFAISASSAAAADTNRTTTANAAAAAAPQPAQTAPSHCQHIANEYALAQCKAKWGEQ
jgi:hypothetical protein